MGVSAAGKSTVGRAVAQEWGVSFVDADDLHPEPNRRKMASGVALTDEDRWPWLDAVGAEFDRHRASGLVVACSALRVAYRDRIRSVAPLVHFIHLDGAHPVLRSRAQARTDHFMPAHLLDSQIATLEPLQSHEAGIVVDVAAEVHEIVAGIVGAMRVIRETAESR
jgi:carbohydrate kinase (thermoresistant glucokinase family)